MSLYQKYRPTKLSQIRGNEDIVKTLEKMLSIPEKCPHAFLFHGPTGTGKTTLARIIANRLECGEYDLMEMNIADIRGIDNIREVIQKSRYMPMEGKCRVWILDEFHMATKDAQNALLKLLEDSPKAAYFIICTTDPQKLIETIKGRCIQFQTKLLTEEQMFGLLHRVARTEGETLETEVLEQIAQDSLGHPRNALNILEQVLASEPESRLEVAKQTAAMQSHIIDLCRALIKKAGWKEVRTILAGLNNEEPETIRRAILGYCQSILLKEDNPQAEITMEMFLEPTYNTGMAGIVYASYFLTKN